MQRARGGRMDKFPIGAIMNKGLTVRAAQQHGQKYVKRLLERSRPETCCGWNLVAVCW